MPIILVAVLAIAQVGVVVRDQLALEEAARNAARAASVTNDQAASIARGQASTAVDDIEVALSEADGSVTATASRPIRGLPIVGVILGGRTQQASVTMMIEPP